MTGTDPHYDRTYTDNKREELASQNTSVVLQDDVQFSEDGSEQEGV